MDTLSSLCAYCDLSTDALLQQALENNEGVLSATGALSVRTGARTGRSPKDRFIVQDELTTDTVDWGVINRPVAPHVFDALWDRAEEYLSEKKQAFVSHLRVGADERLGFPVKVVTELAWHNLFAQHLFIKPQPHEEPQEGSAWVILNVPGLLADPERDGTHSEAAVMINLLQRKVLLVGMRYAGEMKKAMFSVMNYFLPDHDVLPMHCAANQGESGDEVALFFGLSGTGKTTLSADPERYLIGDDEHGWSESGVFNIEGGCYAKCIDLSEDKEPLIYRAIASGAVIENVVLKADGHPDYSDSTYTLNTRAAYPRDFIEHCVPSNRGGVPKALLFLSCDLYGVLPPISLLTKEQAAYYFLSGYTALVGSTEVGSPSGITPTFSACFGAPFFPRPPTVYAELLMKRIEHADCQVYLINTGWTRGGFGSGGRRFSISTTRAIVRAAVSGSLREADCNRFPGFNFLIPKTLESVDTQLLNPSDAWPSQTAYSKQAMKLIHLFIENFKKFRKFQIPSVISTAGPQIEDLK